MLDVPLQLVGADVGDRDAGGQQGDQDRPGRGADELVELPGVGAEGLLEGGEGAHGPGGAEDAATTDDQPPARPAHPAPSRFWDSSASESTMLCPSTSTSGIALRSALSP